MNILFLVHNLGPNRPESLSTVHEGGCEQFTYNLAHKLSLNHTCFILYPDIKKGKQMYVHKIKGFRNEHLGVWEESTNYTKTKKFASFLIENNIDIINIQHLIHIPVEFTLVAKALGVPMVLSIHDYYYLCEEHFLQNDRFVTCNVPKNIRDCVTCLGNKSNLTATQIIRRREIMEAVLDTVDKIIVPSKSVRSDYFKIHPEINDKMEVVPIGTNCDEQDQPILDFTDDDTIHIGVKSYLTYMKGSLPITNVLKICEIRAPKVKFIFQCEVIEEKMYNYFSQFKNVVIDSDSTERIDISWIPSIAKETFSLVVSESILKGIPVMCRKKGAFIERLSEDMTFFHSDTATVEDIAQSIIDIRKDPLVLKTKTINTAKYKESVPTIDYCALVYEDRFKNLLTE